MKEKRKKEELSLPVKIYAVVSIAFIVTYTLQLIEILLGG